MNKNCYRIVFNKARGMLMVVAEIARAVHGGTPTTRGSRPASHICRPERLRLCLWLALGMVSTAQATVIADRTAPGSQQPGIINSANGTPQVNIQTPGKGGVSRNVYSQFDVGSKGVILNNSHANTQTQLGGMITANPWLAKGEARVILNEVNTRDPSKLNGFIEVAGQKAQVVIANPAGITCDGCGFINANRATLTTGQVQLNAEGIAGYRTEQGTVTITGSGMNSTLADHTDIIARSVEVNAGLWANDLRITSGTSQVDAAHQQVSRVESLTTDRPVFGIDVAQLGGMYAGKIRLTGTGYGVGVRNAGHIGAQAGTVVISSDGRIENSGQLTAQRDVQLTTNSDLSNSGTLYATGNSSVTAAGAVLNSGFLGSAQNLIVQAQRIDSDTRGILVAGVQADGSMAASGNLTITSQSKLTAQGQNQATGDLDLSGDGIELHGSQTVGRTITLNGRGNAVTTADAVVSADEKLTVQQASLLDNRNGSLSADRLQLEAASLDNRGGLLQQKGEYDLSLTLRDGLNNQDGAINSYARRFRIDTSVLDNTRGQLLHDGDQFTLNATRLQGDNGDIFSLGALTLNVDLLQLNSSQTQAQQITVRGDSLSHQGSTMLQTGAGPMSLTLQNTLNNQNGKMVAQAGNLTLSARDVNNRQGLLATSDTLTVQSRTIDNTAGTVQAGKQASLVVDHLDNHGGSITGDALDIRTPGALLNQNGELLSSGDILIAAGWVDNTGGLLLAGQKLELTISDTLNNTQGQLQAGNTLNVKGGKTLVATNTGGTMIAGVLTHVKAQSLTGDGDLLSLGTLALTLTNAFTNTGRLIAEGSADIIVKQAVTNSGQIQANGTLTLTANKLTNNASGEISAGENHLIINNVLINKGLLDGGLTWLESGSLTNAPNGRIYGDRIAIATGHLENSGNNKKAPVIAARERLDIGAQSISNKEHGLIYSAGDLAIGSQLTRDLIATGQGHQLDNHSARIEAGGNLWLNIATLNNINDHFSTRVATTEVSQRHEMTFNGDTARYDWNDVDTSSKDKYGVRRARSADGKSSQKFYEYNYTRTVKETQVVSSDPGQIVAGGDMAINAGEVTNRDSQIVAGGTLAAEVGTLSNDATTGERITTDDGKQTYWYPKKTSSTLGGTKTSQGKKNTSYKPAPLVETLVLGIHTWQGNAAVTGSGTTIAGRNDVTTGQGVSPVTVVPISGTQGTDAPHEIRIITPDLRLPDNSLFTLHPQSGTGYLVETDPRFTNNRQWLGSDYMMSQLSSDPNYLFKRLGDGYYEQKLIRDQVLNLTGERFLDGFANDETQFQQLMDNGLTFASQYALSPGVALTAEQMALLTADMVWMVKQTVTLPDGSQQEVLVPQVYVSVRRGDVDGSGALIAGRNVGLHLSGDLNNSGTLAAADRAQINARTIASTGRMDAGLLSLTAREDIINTGGQLTGRDGVSLTAGRDIISRSTLTTNADGQYLDRLAGIFVENEKGVLSLAALNDIRLDASQVISNGDALLQAGHDLTLGVQTQTHSENSRFDKHNYRTMTQYADTGSTLSAASNMTLLAGNNLSATAATLNAGDALRLQAGNDITLDAGQNGYHLTEHSRQASRGLVSGSSRESHDEWGISRVSGTALGADTISIASGHDLTVRGSQVAGTHDVTLQAGNNLTLTTAAESSQETHWSKEKKTGFSGTGGIGFSYGTQDTRITDTSDNQSGYGSIVGSQQGDLTLRAGNQLNVNASELIAGQDMTLSGKAVSITAPQDSSVQTHKVEQKTSGLTLALSGTAGSALNTAVQTAQDARQEDDDRLSGLMATKAALSGVQASQALQLDDARGDTNGNDNTVGISLSYGSQSSSSSQTQTRRNAQESQLTAGNNLSIIATEGDLTIQGSQQQAGQDVLLSASQDINLLSAQNAQQLTGKNDSRGGSVGIGIGVGSGGWGINISASANKGKGSEKGTGTTHSETTVNAGRKVTLVSGRDTTLQGAQVSGESIRADIGRNLTLTSEQDSDRYDMKQQNANAGGSFSYGSMSGSAGVSLSQDKMHSNYDSVVEQTGLFAGRGGFDIRVGEHTQLNGAVIASTAGADLNWLDTGTLGFSDIHNRADYKVEHISAGFSSGGGIGSQFAGNMANSLLVGLNGEGHDSSTTKAAISEGTIILRDTEHQRQDIADVSRDVEHANQMLSPIFDKEKEQKRLQQAQLIGDISNQLMDIARTEEAISASRQANETLSKATPEERDAARAAWEKANPGHRASEKDINSTLFEQAYAEATKNSDFGTGGKYQRAMQAATAAIQGLAGGDMAAAIAGAAAPYIAGIIASAIPEDDQTARLLAQGPRYLLPRARMPPPVRQAPRCAN